MTRLQLRSTIPWRVRRAGGFVGGGNLTDLAKNSREEFLHGLGAVADLVFHVVPQFSEGLGVAVWDEEGIIAETVSAFGGGDDLAFAGAVEKHCAEFSFVEVGGR